MAELLAAPVMTTLLGKSGFNERHPLSLGTGSHSRTSMVEDALANCDAVFGIGASLTRTIFAPPIPPGQRTIIHATNDWCDLNKDYVAGVPILGDAKLVLEQMVEEIRSQTGGSGRAGRDQVEEHLRGLRRQWNARWSPKLASDQTPINPYRVMGEFMKATDPAETIVTHDSGNPRDQLVPIYESVTPRGYLGWGHSTQLGFSLGAAMGSEGGGPGEARRQLLGRRGFRHGRHGRRNRCARGDPDPDAAAQQFRDGELRDVHPEVGRALRDEVSLGQLQRGRPRAGRVRRTGGSGPRMWLPRSSGASPRRARASRRCSSSSPAKNRIWRRRSRRRTGLGVCPGGPLGKQGFLSSRCGTQHVATGRSRRARHAVPLLFSEHRFSISPWAATESARSTPARRSGSDSPSRRRSPALPSPVRRPSPIRSARSTPARRGWS